MPEQIGVLLTPGFSMMSFTPVIEAQRIANRVSGRTLYRWHVLSKNGLPVPASNGIVVSAEASLAEAGRYAHLIVVADNEVRHDDDRAVFAQLRRLARGGMSLGAINLGTYLLARAGLLDGYRCTVHWENLSGFVEMFPHLEVTSKLFEVDRDRFTCSGGIAALDMMLHVIAVQHGTALAKSVSEQFLHERIRDTRDHQRMRLSARLGIRHPRLLNVICRMEENLEDPASRAELARFAGVSARQLERLFRRYLARSPAEFYMELRLDRARHLLKQTEMTVLKVAVACGFASPSHFSKCYRERFQNTPREERDPPRLDECNRPCGQAPR